MAYQQVNDPYQTGLVLFDLAVTNPAYTGGQFSATLEVRNTNAPGFINLGLSETITGAVVDATGTILAVLEQVGTGEIKATETVSVTMTLGADGAEAVPVTWADQDVTCYVGPEDAFGVGSYGFGGAAVGDHISAYNTSAMLTAVFVAEAPPQPSPSPSPSPSPTPNPSPSPNPILPPPIQPANPPRLSTTDLVLIGLGGALLLAGGLAIAGGR